MDQAEEAERAGLFGNRKAQFWITYVRCCLHARGTGDVQGHNINV